MIVRAQGKCTCGVAVAGDLDEASREFVHRFSFAASLDGVVRTRVTEVEGIRLVTFAPGDEWSVECPICRSRILLPSGA